MASSPLNEGERSLRVLVVGGGSRAARAFRRFAAGSELEIATLVRSPVDSAGGEDVHIVSDYFSPPTDLLRWADVVVNFVGITKGRDEALLKSVNVEGPARLAAQAKRLGAKHFIQLSTFHVYGHAEHISQTTALAPLTPYARSKLTADRILLALSTEQFIVTILRLPVLYGDGVGENLHRLTSLIASAPVFVVAEAPQLRSAMHVDNLASLLQSIVTARIGGIQFGADAEPYSIHLLIDLVEEASGHRPRLIRLSARSLSMLRFISAGLHSRLFRPNLLLQRDRVVSGKALPVPIGIGLKDILPLSGR